MITIYIDLALDFTDGDSLKSVNIKQGETNNGKYIRLSLYNNGEPVDLEGDEDTRLYGSIDGVQVVSNRGCSVYEGKIIIPVMSGENGISSVAGVQHCEVKISGLNGSRTVFTPTFDVIVSPAVVSSRMED